VSSGGEPAVTCSALRMSTGDDHHRQPDPGQDLRGPRGRDARAQPHRRHHGAHGLQGAGPPAQQGPARGVCHLDLSSKILLTSEPSPKRWHRRRHGLPRSRACCANEHLQRETDSCLHRLKRWLSCTAAGAGQLPAGGGEPVQADAERQVGRGADGGHGGRFKAGHLAEEPAAARPHAVRPQAVNPVRTVQVLQRPDMPVAMPNGGNTSRSGVRLQNGLGTDSGEA